MNKTIVKFEEMPKTILGFKINIDKTSYSVINSHLNPNAREFIEIALSYYQYEEMAKITITDIEKRSNAIQFVETKGMKINYERLYKCA